MYGRIDMSEKITLLDRWEICRMLGESEHEWMGQTNALLCIGWDDALLEDGTVRRSEQAAEDGKPGSALINFTYGELVLFARAVRRQRTVAERFLHTVFPLDPCGKHTLPPLLADPEAIAGLPRARLSKLPEETDMNFFRLIIHYIGEPGDHTHYVDRLNMFTLAEYIKQWLAPTVDF